MPVTIQLSKLITVAQTLSINVRTDLGGGVEVIRSSQTFKLFHNGNEVFKINAVVEGTNLQLDRAETPPAHRKRGWGRLGLLLVLRWGTANNCVTADLGTQIEPGAYEFWGGLQKDQKKSIQTTIIRAMNWIHSKIPQPGLAGTSIMTIRDPEVAVKPRRRSFG